MSTGIRIRASTDKSPTAITATRTVKGRRRAARISHISLTSRSAAGQVEKRLQVPLGECLVEHRLPDCQPGYIVLDFRLKQEALGIGNLHDGGEPSLITSRCLRL